MADVLSPLAEIRTLVADDFAAMNQLIQKRLHSDIDLIEEISHHIVKSGGKRLRPLLVLLTARALHYPGKAHIDLAAIIEFLHTATLLHDDVVDASTLRRGQQTANALWGNEASILVGDFLYSRAFQMMASLQNLSIMTLLADTTNLIAGGEAIQLMNRNNPRTSEEHYLKVIHLKTAKLFEVACQLGAIITQAPLAIENACLQYGLHFGMAYQLVDDVLDFSADAQISGKNLGDDLAEGKPTLPLIYALQHGNSQQQKIIRDAIENGGLNHLEEILQTIHITGALTYAKNLAQQQTAQAINALKHLTDSPYRDALIQLAEFALHRNY